MPHSISLITTIAAALGEQNRGIVVRLRERNIPAVSGDASEPAVLVQAHIAQAGMLVIATPDTFDVRKMVGIARMLNPTIETVMRTHNEDDAGLLEKDNLGKVLVGEHELALGMTMHILERMGKRDGTHAAPESKIGPSVRGHRYRANCPGRRQGTWFAEVMGIAGRMRSVVAPFT